MLQWLLQQIPKIKGSIISLDAQSYCVYCVIEIL